MNTQPTLSSGTKLGKWILGRVLGEGACGKVYEVSNGVEVAGFPCVVKVIPLGSGKGKDLKQSTAIANSLNHENQIYQGACLELKYRPRIPRFSFGEDEGAHVRYLVMEKLDRDLTTFSKSKPKPSVSQIAQIGIQILDGLKFLHTLGFIFVDMKPDNFMLKACGKELCFVDFGCTERWLSYNGAGPRVQTGPYAPVGTPNYVSISMQKGNIPTRMDDCESMCYVLLSLTMECSLPWHSTVSMQEVFARKEATNMTALCAKQGVPQIGEIIQICRAAARDSQPDYDAFMKKLQVLAISKSSGTGASVTTEKTKASARRPIETPLAEQEDEDEPFPKPSAKRAKVTSTAPPVPSDSMMAYLTLQRDPPMSIPLPIATGKKGVEYTVGREETADIMIEGDEFISEAHMQIKTVHVKREGGVQANIAVRDTSFNGTKINGTKIAKSESWVSIGVGDVLTIGRTNIRIDAVPAQDASAGGRNATKDKSNSKGEGCSEEKERDSGKEIPIRRVSNRSIKK